MNKYKITIYNWGNSLIYQKTINARNENQAIKDALEYITLASGDKIEIEEL